MEDATGNPTQKRAWRPDVREARIVLAIVGLGSLVVGLRAAWETRTGTAAIIVGGILLVFAVVFDEELARLSWRFRDSQLDVERVPRSQAGALERMSELLVGVVTRADGGGTDPRNELEEVRREVWEIAAEASRLAEEERAFEKIRDEYREMWWKPTGQEPRPLPNLSRLHVSYRLASAHEDLAPYITFSFTWWGSWHVLCEVGTPTGGTHQATLGSFKHGGSNFFGGAYPRSFPGAPQSLEPGTYEFVWARVGPRTSSGRRLKGDTVAHDALTITSQMLNELNEGRAVEPQVESRLTEKP